MASASLTSAADSSAKPSPWLGKLVRACCKTWNEFFHAPVDPVHVAILRILMGCVAVVYFAAWIPFVDDWFGEQGIYPYAVSRECSSIYCWTLLAWAKEGFLLHLALYVAVIQAVLLTVGLFSRVQAVGIFVWAFSFQHRNNLIMDSEDVVFRLLCFYLMWLPLGERFSLDAVWKRWQAGTATLPHSTVAHSAWPIRMMQIQMVVLMASAAGWKLAGSDWRSGETLYYVCRLDDLFGRFPLPDFIFEVPWVCRSITWITVAMELLAPLLIWFPSTRRLSLVLMLLFHIATDYMMHLFLFHWIMMIGWLAFLTPADYAWLFRRNES